MIFGIELTYEQYGTAAFLFFIVGVFGTASILFSSPEEKNDED